MKIIIHIGFPKSASTFLQTQIFSKHNEINFLGRPSEIWSKYFYSIEEKIFCYDDTQFEKELPDILKHIGKLKLHNSKINLLSHEGFLRATRYEIKDGANIYRNITRLHKIFESFGEVYFFFVIRNHLDFLYSHYIQFFAKLDKILI